MLEITNTITDDDSNESQVETQSPAIVPNTVELNGKEDCDKEQSARVPAEEVIFVEEEQQSNRSVQRS